jgi:predicted O-linked N-acetylglucosamine transferase (SPINDLY family)
MSSGNIALHGSDGAGSYNPLRMSSPTPVTVPQALKLAQQAVNAQDFRQAEIILRKILAAEPNQPQALQLYGRLALRANQPAMALEMLTASEKLQPNDRFIHLDLGNVFLVLGRMEEAAAQYRRCLEISPNDAGAWSNLGVVLHELGQQQEALEALHKALALEPDVADRHNNLGTALTSLGRSHEAADAYRRAIQIKPDFWQVQQNLAHACKDIGQVDEAIRICRELLALNPNSHTLHSNLLIYMMYSPTCTPRELFEEHRRWNRQHAAPLGSEMKPHTNDRSPDRRLRVGYFSPDFREHSVSYFFENLLAAHDPAQVEVFCYADMLRKKEDTSARLRALAPHWTNITGLPDQQVAEIIRKDQIDILVDLAGHTGGSRLLLLARQPAPVQVSYLGYPNTTGLDAIQYGLTDPYLDPPGGADELYSETLIRLPRTFACYRPPEDAPDLSPLPAASKGFLTFASFNAFPKVTARVIEVWSKILQRVPGSRLLIGARGVNTPEMSGQIRAAFSAQGIEPQRLWLSPYQPRSEYLATHHQIDILLDTFPVNGHTISCHALWMGVPVISLIGNARFGRLGSSVLNNLGLPELLAQSEDQYIDIAVNLASDLPRLEQLRSTLRQRMSQSPLMDAKSLARDIENAYREMWRTWTAS